MSPVLQTGKTLIVVFNLVCASALARSASAPLGDFAPCDAEADGYSEVVEAVINTPLIGERFVSYTHYPSFSSESGVRVFRTEDGYVLRAVEIHRSSRLHARQVAETWGCHTRHACEIGSIRRRKHGTRCARLRSVAARLRWRRDARQAGSFGLIRCGCYRSPSLASLAGWVSQSGAI